MNKLFFALILLALFLTGIAYAGHVIYFPIDILNLFPVFHTNVSVIPHNTLVSDPVSQFEPWRHFAKETMFSGVFPLWNNLNSGGVPLFGNAQSAVLFPLNALYYIFPSGIAVNLIPLLKLILLFYFTVLYLKSVKVSDRVSILGGIAVCFSGFSLVWLLWPHTNVFIFLPFFLYLTEKMREGRGEKMWYFLLSLGYCIAIFGGHYETLLHIMLLHIPYTFFRFRFNKTKFLTFILFILLGILLSSIQLIPFLEYFLNSSALAYRTHSSYLYLPLQSAVLNILPFLSGAPHLSHYRPIVPVTNFQESMGGYTGVIILLTALVGAISLVRKISLIKIWTTIAITCWLLAFKIWPVGLLLELPLLSQAQNSRLSAMAAFATIIIFVFTIEKITVLIKKRNRLLPMAFGIVAMLMLCCALSIEVLAITTKFEIFHHPYVTQLTMHIIFIAFTTLLFIPALYFAKKSKLFVFFIAMLVGLQTLYLLAGYIPFLNVSAYYPYTSVIKKLQTLPRGVVLEVGNPSLPPDINLMYGISLAQNYDGIGIKGYDEEFNKAFPSTNQWGKVERVSPDKLERFNISYVLSDYNINYPLQKVQPNFTSLIGPITSSRKIKINFTPHYSNLMEIRFLPANYNRKNTCILEIGIIDKELNERIFEKNVDCKSILDKMYFTLKTNGLVLNPKKNYMLTITSEETNPQNGVGVWGADGTPFTELYFDQKHQLYKLFFDGNGVKLFGIPRSDTVRIEGGYEVLRNTSNEFQFSYETGKDAVGEVKKTFYPGWKANIDGKEVPIDNGHPFMKIAFPKGKHIVSIYYDPLSFKLGIALSVVGLVILLSAFKFKKLP